PFDVSTSGDNNVTIKLPEITAAGDVAVTVKYNGSDIYLPSTGVDEDGNEFKNIIVERQKVYITVETDVDSVYIGEDVIITGKLTDDMGNDLTNTLVMLNITGQANLIPVWTNSTGGYTYDYTTDTVGEIFVNATFTDYTNKYNNATNNTTFTVGKIPTNTSVAIVNTTLGNVTINVTVIDVYQKPVPNGTVYVYDEAYTDVIANGTVVNGFVESITIPVDKAGEVKVVVEYQEDVNYLASNATNETSGDEIITIDVTKIPTITSVEILNNTLGNVTIAVNVTNMTGELVSEGKVKVFDSDATEIANATLTGGRTTIKLPVQNSGQIKVVVEYQENDYYLASNATNKTTGEEKITIDVNPMDTSITVNATSPVKTLHNTTITGKLTDEYNNIIPKAEVTIKVDNQTIGVVKTDETGTYVINHTAPVGLHEVTVDYPGDKNHNPSNNTTTFEVVKQDPIINATIDDVKVGNNTVEVNLTDEDGNPIDDVDVVIKDEDGKVIGNGTVHDGKVEIDVPLEPGKQVLTVETIGDDNYNPATTTVEVEVPKYKTNVTVDPIENITVGNSTDITGVLKDEFNNTMPYANITLLVNDEEIQVKTDENGRYNYSYPADATGIYNVTVRYKGNDTHEPSQTNTTFEVVTRSVTIVVNPMDGIVEDNITIQANITDMYGLAVDKGEVLFKINGITLREGGKLTGNDTLRVPVSDGTAIYTFVATRELLGSKNITAVYIANDDYNENRTDGTTHANVTLRTAEIIISTNPERGNQKENITLIANVYDITHNLRNVRPIDDDASFVIFKVNGLTLKDDAGNALLVPVHNGIAQADYYIPAGMGGMKSNTGQYKDYNITAEYYHPDYYDVTNNSVFNINRADNVTFKVNNLGIVNRTLNVEADLVDKDGDNLVGENIVAVKINGLTLKDDEGNVITYPVKNGKVDLDIPLPDTFKEIKNITLVTGNREAYSNATLTTSNITTSPSKITITDITGIVEENITFSAYVTDEYDNPLSGGYVIFKLNGQILRKGGTIGGNNTILKIGVKGGWANYTMPANYKLINAVKLDAAYSGNANYDSSRASPSSKVNITLRIPHVVVTTIPNITRQSQILTITVNVTDWTHGESNIAPINSKSSYAILKINGITVKDKNNETVKLPIRNGSGEYKYNVPQAFGGINYPKSDLINYNVTAKYTHNDYYNGQNATVFNVEQSSTSITFNKVNYSSASGKISIQAQIKDYQNKTVKGDTKFNVKINGVTIKEDDSNAKMFISENGVINITVDSVSKNPTSITVVTQERCAYASTRTTTNNIVKT
ncbi:MAG: hypothetical protein BZ137_03605, partial [Methanosphaera sp. rholeuAM130]